MVFDLSKCKVDSQVTSRRKLWFSSDGSHLAAGWFYKYLSCILIQEHCQDCVSLVGQCRFAVLVTKLDPSSH